jgi:uncharacterized protein
VTDLAEFDRHRYVSLATFRRSGAEVRTPAWFAAADGRLYVFTAGEPGKVKRLRHSSRARAPLRAKYGWQMRLGDLFSRLAGRINRRAWIEIHLKNFDAAGRDRAWGGCTVKSPLLPRSVRRRRASVHNAYSFRYLSKNATHRFQASSAASFL